MSDTLYELVFDGLLVDGVSYAQAQQNVVKLFKATPEQVEKMFNGGRIVIRNKLDKVSGDKYVAVLYKNGLMCRLEPMKDMGTVSQTAQTSVARPTVQTPAPAPPSEKSQSIIDKMLMHSNLKVDPPGVRMSEPKEVKPVELHHQSELQIAPVGTQLSEHVDVTPPVFSHMAEFEVAEVGERLSEEEIVVPVAIGDISQISVAPVGSEMGQLKPEVEEVHPDISKLKLADQ
jgi:hypothetical protein